MEDKGAFVDRIVEALVENGDGRYDGLRERPVRYEDMGRGMEVLYIEANGAKAGTRNVGGNSLLALLRDVYEMLA